MKSFKLILFAAAGLVLASSCVAKKKFTALESERNTLASNLEQTEEKVKMLEEEKTQLTTAKKQLEESVDATKAEVAEYTAKVETLRKNLEERDVVVKELEEEKAVVDDVFSGAEKVMKEKSQAVKPLDDRLYLVLDDPINFKTGSARLSKADKEVVGKIADVLTTDSTLHFVVEGHTDHRPISNARYKDNWELSVARAMSIARQLVKMGVKQGQLTVAGRSATAPKVDAEDKDKEKLEQNRRTEIYVFPSLGKLYQMRHS